MIWVICKYKIFKGYFLTKKNETLLLNAKKLILLASKEATW